MRSVSVIAGRAVAALLCTSSLLAAGTAPAWAQAFSNLGNARVAYSRAELKPAKSCEALDDAKFGEIVAIESVTVPASASAPAFCRVTGTLAPEIAFEVSLPANWNGRFYMIGNGGHAGDTLDAPNRIAERNTVLEHGFAFAQTNTGHYASEEPGASFVLSNPQKAIDYAYRAVHLTASTAKAITADYYGMPPSYAYWNSCSNGGRQGLIEAQRYPEDFDGIIADAPWVDQTGFTLGAMWNQRALIEAPVTAGKLALVSERVMATCDAVDGLADGLIDDPRACDFEPARDVPICATGTDDDSCLTPSQAEAIGSVYRGVISDGKLIFPGFMPGSEAVTTGLRQGGSGSGWLDLIVPRETGGRPADFNLAENTMRYLVFTPPQPDWDYRTFDFDDETGLLEAWGAQANAKNPDLREFRARGGKLLMTYGWADAVLQPLMGVSYYESALEENGPETRDFFRLFMVPGMAHCRGGIGPDQRDSVTAIIDWVEAGRAPESIIASKIVDGETVRTRPLCPYPQVARYTGQGSIDDAANFRCVMP